MSLKKQMLILGHPAKSENDYRDDKYQYLIIYTESNTDDNGSQY